MRIIRTWICSAFAVFLFIGVAWSLVILFFKVVLSPVTRADRPLTAAFSPVHVGYEGLSVSLPKPGIPFEPNRLQSIGGRDLTQWLRPQEDLNAVTPVLDKILAVEGIKPGFKFREAPLLYGRTGITVPVDSNEFGFVIMVIVIPAEYAILCSH